MTALVTTSKKDGILTITMDRADKKNALNLEMYEAMAKAITDANSDPDVNVIMIKGSGDSFCAGNDLGDFLANPPTSSMSPVVKFLNAISETNIPVVAAVNGVAVGIGVTMLLHCDFVYIDENAPLSLPFVNLGLVPEAASSMILPQLAGHPKAAELLMLGETFSAQDALELGIANEICATQDLDSTAMNTAKKLAAKPREALQNTKALMRREFESVASRIQKENDAFKDRLASAETQATLAGFFKRKPK